MGMRKEIAIENANEKATETNRKHYVIATPETYNDIFNNTMYQVVDKIEEDEKASVVYRTK